MTSAPLRQFWPWAPTRFYAAPGLVLHVSDEGDDSFSAWAGATHRSALTPLADAAVEWTRFDVCHRDPAPLPDSVHVLATPGRK